MGNNVLDNEINGHNNVVQLQHAINRRTSYYDNNSSSETSNLTNLNTSSSTPNDRSINDSRYDKSPSQMVFLSTTVPQNIASQNIAGKHAPTRNSLRHSRMIVLNRGGNVKRIPAVVKHYKFIKSLLILITFFGTVLCALSLLLLLWSPNMRSRNNTYWSAIPVIFSGILGFLYLSFVPKKTTVNRLTYWTKSLKIISTSASTIAAMACFAMCIFSTIHAVTVTTMTCAPPDKVNTSCLCKPNLISLFDSYHYIDLSCGDVNNMLYIIVIPTIIINTVVCVCEVTYLYMQWFKRTSYVYARVPVNNNADKVVTDTTDAER